ncbi:unnamed protein product (macronuclear) [Paramecium tetraurelia]|uniref:BEACH domain-containing protein n=1 Tax=Paramecium tetraurelia TaxID=5888 RepID=A0DMC4_PARTE|nr:uncharacterized protein GSPATT00018409001 [Paramecium tetraurelia]CAK84191.1 unnamed protein product [Paramecium tetraurelia]|eukprot:XP_001451588.1 hypothetical protein (macronuclear) [Paramecium tetraurelia strain d4-2]
MWQQSKLKEQSNLLFFQGGASSLQINLLPNPISILEGKIRLKIINSENESSKFQELDQMNLDSFLDNFEYAEKLIIFTLYFTKDQEIQISICKMKKFIIIYKEGEFHQEQDYLTNLDLTSWFNIDFQLKNNQNLIVQINEQNFIFQLQQQEDLQPQFSKFVFGVNINDQLQESNEEFNCSIELLDQCSFEGQVSEFYLIINNSKIQFEQIKKTNLKRQTMIFINSEVFNENQQKFDELFSISPVLQNECKICFQNVYKLDMKKGIDFIQKCGGFNIFNMILDLLYTECENTNARDSEQIIILVLKIFQENMMMWNSKVSNFINSQNLQNMEENCKRWININQMISNEFIIQLLLIYSKMQNEQSSFLFLITIIKILDNQFTTFDQIKLICTSSIIQTLITSNCLRKFMNIHLYYESRYLFAQVSIKMSQAFMSIEEKHLFSYSLSKCIQYQGDILIPEINPITNFFNLLVSQKCFNLFTLDILQIIDILIKDRMKQKNNIKIEEETILNSFKYKIFQILKNDNRSFIYEFEVNDKMYELTFSIYSSIVFQLRQNSKENGELNTLQIYFDYFLKNRIEVGQLLISKVLTLIKQFEVDVLLIKKLVRFQNQLMLNLLIKDSVKRTILIWYLDLFKNAALKKWNSDILILKLVKLQSFPMLMKNLMTISLDNKQNSLDLFTYLVIYLIEMYPNLTSETLYEVHIQSQILSNDSFNQYLQVVYHTTISFYALKQAQPFQGEKDESKLVNIIILYMHIEKCIGEISNFEIVDWNQYSQIMDKGIDLFNYLGILFYDHDYIIPDFEDTFDLKQIKEDYNKMKKQNNRILPNGGIKRLMQQLIAPFVKIPQMIKPIRNYLSINKYNIEGRIDQQSCQRIKKFIDQEFSVYLFITKKQYRQQLTTMLHNADLNQGRIRIKENGSKLVKHYKFYQLLVYFALFENNQPNDNQLDKQILKNQSELQEILGQFKLTRTMDWKNVDPKLIQCFFHQQKESQEQILKAFNKLNTLKMQVQSSKQSIISTHDLSQIDLSNNELANSIRLSIFMDIIIYYQLIHKLWVLYPIIMEPQEKQRTQSNLLVYPKLSVLTLFEDSYKEQQRTHSQYQESGYQSQCGQVKDQLQLIQQKLNSFIYNKKCNFKFVETRQWKWVFDLSDFTRKHPFLQITKINQLYCSQDEIDHQFDKQQIQRMKKEQDIQNKINNAIMNLRKRSPENNQVGITKYNCEYITYQGVYQGVLKFNEINQSLQFEQQELESEELFSSPQVIQTTENIFLEITLDRIMNVHPRRFLLMEIAIEIFIDRQNYFFNLFKNSEQQLLLQEFRKKKVQVIDPKQEFKKMNYQEKWVEGQLSNFHYLMLVNIFSGRTCNDLSQYFVFPWVIQNYKSYQIDFYSKEGSDTFRNLKLPVGAIAKNSEQIIKDYMEREITSTNGNYQHKHHYSNAQTVLKYLIRLIPSKLMDEFSTSERLFSSIENLWENSINYDNKELIPEFYYMPEFLRNINLQQQSRIPVVELPNWVKTQTPEEFVYIMRLALESDTVSNELNHWIDLIFGNKSIGQNAVDSANMFHHLTYQENWNKLLNQSNDYLAIKQYLTKIQDIGQTPKQLFKKNHQKRVYSLQVFTNEIPDFGNDQLKQNKLFVFQQFDRLTELRKSQILGFYPYSKKCIYILKTNDKNYNNLTLLETKHFQDHFDFYPEIQLKQMFELPELKTDGCNPQNMFSFIYEQQFDFGDGYDSQYYSVFEGKQNYKLYLCLVGFLDESLKIYDLRNKMKKININFPTSDLERQKRTSCVRFHAVSKILAIGSLDGLLQLFQIQFNHQLQVKGVFTKQLENGILCIDLTDLLILTIDYKNIANLLSLEGNVLHTIYIDKSNKFWQCCIQMQFLVFKSVNSQISIFTMNGEQYVKPMTLLERTSSKNIMFTTPFSSTFLLYSLNQKEDEDMPKFVPVIYYFDIFDLKFKQQQFGFLNFNRILVNKGNLRGSGISAIHISFMRCKVDKQKKMKHIYLIAVDNQILQYMDEHYGRILFMTIDYLKMMKYYLKKREV